MAIKRERLEPPPEVAIPEICSGYLPGSIGRIVEMHGTYYGAHWGFGSFFEVRMARELAQFVSDFDPRRDGLWTAVTAGRVEGSIAIDGTHAPGQEAHLRWFIVAAGHGGKGSGRRLLGEAVDFCRRSGLRRVSLWTFSGLDAARRLYEQSGFRLTAEQRGAQWGTEVVEQRFELLIPDA